MGFFQNKIVQIVIACLIPFAGGFIVSLLTQNKMYPWYNEINLPSWNPPSWIFGPVWTYLYLSMGYASYRVWESGKGFDGIAKIPLIIYLIHLLLNLTWTPVFFSYHLLGAATIHIFVLLASVIITGISFYRVDQVAGILIAPYAAWVSFASVLCFTIWRLNTSSS
jgi:translocator protein